MRIDEFEFQDRNGNEIEPTKNQLVVYIKSLHKQIAELQKQLKASEQLQDQKVIEVLDKVKYDLLDISSPYWQYFAKSGNAFMTYEDIEQWVKEFIDNKIKNLKMRKIMNKQTISIKGKLTVDTSSNTVIPPSLEPNKVYIWGYELCKGSDWNDFLEVVNKLGEENQQLQKQLEEKEKYTYTGKEVGEIERKYDEKIDTLEQQLKSQPAEIVDKIKGQLIKRLNTIAGYGRMTTDELSFFIETEFGSDLDKVLKEYQK